MRRSPSLPRAALTGALLAALAACDDAPLTAPADHRPGAIVAPLQLNDAGIDPSDTYLVADASTTTSITIDYGTSTWDPATGRMTTSVTLPTITEDTHTEAGYGSDGAIRIGTWYAGDTAGGVARVQIVGDSVTYYDAGGVPRSDLPGRDLIATLGSFANDVVTDSIILADDISAGSVLPAAVRSPARRPGAVPGAAVAPGVAARVAEGETRIIETDVSDGDLRGRRVRAFRRQAGAWVLAEERVETRAERRGMTMSTAQLTRYRNVAWHNAPARDSLRHELAAHAAVAPPHAPPPASTLARPSLLATLGGSAGILDATTLSDVDNGTTGTTTGTTTGSTTGTTTTTTASTSTGTTTTTGTAPLPLLNIGYVHGAASGPGVWGRIRPALDPSFSGVHTAVTLDWRSGLESQARDLFGQLSASGGTGFLLIGHSNGGLVARRTAQLSSGSPGSLVGGVVAISSPHAGVPLARVGRQVVSDFLTAQLQSIVTRIGGSCWRGQFSWLCDFATDAAGEFVPRIVTYALDDLAPFVRDDQPGSAFLSALNSAPEPFRRYSIETASQGRWKFVRMFGDWICAPEDRCSGNHLQNMMESVYEVLRYCGSNSIARAKLGAISDKCRDVRWTLSAIDVQYERWTAPGDESDGLVPLKSQTYPGTVDGRYTKRNARESHPGELMSGRVRDNVANAATTFARQ